MIDYQRPVRVFVNPARNCYTIMQGFRVLASARQVRLRDATFTVRESGRQKMLRDGKRTVHAWIVGTLVDYTHNDEGRELDVLDGRRVGYNPHRAGHFMDREDQSPVTEATLVQLDEQGARYWQAEPAEAA